MSSSSSSSVAPPKRILIIGGGEFGSTTALQLARGAYKGHADLITILDRSASPPAADAASYDYNKALRQEYSDEVYARLAHEALAQWRSPEWAEYYHECGVVISGRGAAQAELVDKSLAVNFLPGMQTPGKKARRLQGRKEVEGVYPDVPLGLGESADEHLYINTAGGWAAAGDATRAAVARCREAGVQFRSGNVKELVVEGEKVVGARTADGEEHHADLVILCVGAWTPQLVPELQTELLPTGHCIGTIQLDEQERALYGSAPVTWVGDTGFYIFPPTPEGILKFAIHSKGYINPISPLASLPRTHLSEGYESQQAPPEALAALHQGVTRVYPELAAKYPVGTFPSRICWYSDRPTGDFLLDYHPQYSKSLFIAAGCSGHAFKFLPILGRLIVQGINGELPKQLADIWAYETRDPSRVDDLREHSQRKVLP